MTVLPTDEATTLDLDKRVFHSWSAQGSLAPFVIAAGAANSFNTPALTVVVPV